jgi:hypothetical protein
MKETRAFNRLWEHSNNMQSLQKEAVFRKSGGNREPGFDGKKHASLNDHELERMTQAEVSALTNITEETNLLKEIKDILDELSSILLIYKQQETLVDTMGEDEEFELDEELSQEMSSPTSLAGCWKRSRIKRSHTRLTRMIKEHKREIGMLEVEANKTHDAVWNNMNQLEATTLINALSSPCCSISNKSKQASSKQTTRVKKLPKQHRREELSLPSQ